MVEELLKMIHLRDSKLYTTDEFAKDMGEMLDERIRTNDKDPFFTWMAFNAPHAPFEAPDSSILDQYDNLRTRNVLFGMIYRMDLMVGQILKDLERAGELDNTVIIFQSDNGPHMRGSAFPLRGKKANYAEGGIRVPA